MKRTLNPDELAASARLVAPNSHDGLIGVLAHMAGFQFDQVQDAAGKLHAPWRNFALLLAEVAANECRHDDAQRIRSRFDRRLQPAPQQVASAGPVASAASSADSWSAATNSAEREADLRAALVAPLSALMDGGARISSVVAMFINRAKAGKLPIPQAHALRCLTKSTDAVCAVPSASTLRRWIHAYRRADRSGLLPGKSSVRSDGGAA